MSGQILHQNFETKTLIRNSKLYNKKNRLSHFFASIIKYLYRKWQIATITIIKINIDHDRDHAVQ